MDAQTQFDILEWHPYFMSCMRYFLDHAQYYGPVQALAGFLNILLPFQKPNPVLSSKTVRPPGGGSGGGSPDHHAGGDVLMGGASLPSSSGSSSSTIPGPSSSKREPPVGGYGLQSYASATLVPYIRRLVATGFDFPGVLHGFFGDDWEAGIGPLHEQERRNYLFAAKSASWLKVKEAYDMGDEQTVPFLKPLRDATEKEIVGAERCWSEWLAMQDWMLGPRAPPLGGGQGAQGQGQGQGLGHGQGTQGREDYRGTGFGELIHGSGAGPSTAGGSGSGGTHTRHGGHGHHSRSGHGGGGGSGSSSGSNGRRVKRESGRD